MADDLTGCALVTGGAAGIGLAIARRLQAEGRKVAVCDRDPAALGHARSAFGLFGIETDLSEAGAGAGAVNAASDVLGPVSVLVNNAGIAGPAGLAETLPLDGWRETFLVNVEAALSACQAAIPAMKSAGAGAIVNVLSISVDTAPPGRAAYTASKCALMGLTRTLARELGPFGVRCNAVSPGAVAGPRLSSVLAKAASSAGVDPAAFEDDIKSFISLRRFCEAEEIADVVAFLASDHARSVTGQVLRACGNIEWEP